MTFGIPNSQLTDEHLFANGGIFHIEGMFGAAMQDQFRSWLAELPFAPLEHDGVVARHECSLDVSEGRTAEFAARLKNLATKLGLGRVAIEAYAFRYLEGHAVPWHTDTKRHALSAIAYFGEFKGGQYVYRTSAGTDVALAIGAGDAIVSVNVTPRGHWINPLHRVLPITQGERLCLVASAIAESTS